jgi:hypothetical protein
LRSNWAWLSARSGQSAGFGWPRKASGPGQAMFDRRCPRSIIRVISRSNSAIFD